MESANNNPHGSAGKGRRLVRWFCLAVVVAVVLVAVAVLRNNYSLHEPSRSAFDAQMDHALDTATQWIAENPVVSERNVTMMYMISDMESMSHDPRLQTVLDRFRKNYLTHVPTQFDLVWLRLVDPNASMPVVYVPEMGDNIIDFVWFAHAIAPDKIVLADADRANLFSPTKYIWGTRQKQLLGLAIYRQHNGGTPELDRTIDYVARGVARDAHFDIRLTDSYIQRTAFLLAAGRPDLVRSRWVDRILDHQNANGSWYACWYGWCRGVFEFSADYKTSPGGLGHATVQAAWALMLLKYRYPEWINEHYR